MTASYSSLINLQLPESPRLSPRGNEAVYGEFQTVYNALRNLVQGIGNGSGVGVAWGAITGNLSDQLDLTTALNAKLSDAPSDGNLYGRKNGSWTVVTGGGGSGTVTSVNITGTTGITPSGGPITTSGSITLTLSANLQAWSALATSAKYNQPTGSTAQYIRGDGTLATFPTITSGTVTSVDMAGGTGISFTGGPVTSSGTITAALSANLQAWSALATSAKYNQPTGSTAQYIRGDGSLASFPTATPSVAFSAYLSADQTGVASGVRTKVAFNTIRYDTNTWFDTTNNRYTPQVAGYYQINANVRITASSSTQIVETFLLEFYKNGVMYSRALQISGGTPVMFFVGGVAGGAVIDLNGSTDYVEVFVSSSTNGATPLTLTGTFARSEISGFLISGGGTAVGSGTVTSVGSGTGLTGGPITSSGSLAIANTAVTAGSYTNANITVNAQGQLTAASNGVSTSFSYPPGLDNGLNTFFGPIALSASPFAANEGYLYRIFIPTACTLEAFIHVTTAGVSGSKVAAAIYSVNATNGRPATLLTSFTEANGNSATLQSIGSYTIAAGFYWVYYKVSAAMSLNNASVALANNIWGGYTAANVSQSRVTVTNTYVYPPPAGASITYTTSANTAFVGVFFKIT